MSGSASQLVVVGIGADGWTGLGEAARDALRDARTVVGSQRQLDLLPGELPARRRLLPSPLEPLIDELAAGVAEPTCVVATGDPMLHGIGAMLARRIPPERLVVVPQASAFSLACARLGWPAAEVALVSSVARPPEVVASMLQPGRRIVVFATGADGAAQVARVVRTRGFGPSRLVVLEQLGGPGERIHDSTADDWGARDADPLHAVAIDVRAAPGTPLLPTVPGLPDDAYAHDGQLTKRHVRALTLAALAPAPGQLLWDVGAGSGAIAIEWLRAEATARAIAVEARAGRAQRAVANALALGVPRLDVRTAEAPAALDGLPAPDAVFVGGGLTAPGLLDRCWEALRPRGRLVANAVTLEGEQTLRAARAAHGGALTRIEIAHAEPLGSFEAWRAQLPIVQWAATR